MTLTQTFPLCKKKNDRPVEKEKEDGKSKRAHLLGLWCENRDKHIRAMRCMQEANAGLDGGSKIFRGGKKMSLRAEVVIGWCTALFMVGALIYLGW